MEEQDPNQEENKNKTLDSIGKKAKNEASKLAKKAVKFIIAKLAIPVAIILGIVVVISACYYLIHNIILQNLKNAISNFFEGFKIEARTSLDVSDEDVKNLKQIINDMGYTLEDLSMKENDATTDKYLKTFLEAELVTYYPEIGAGGTQGIIKVYRTDGINERTQMQYIKQTDFESRVQMGLEYKNVKSAKEYYNSNIKNFFYIDDNDKLMHIATWTSTEGDTEETFGIGNKTVNYGKTVEKYAMPIEVPISLTLLTQNPEYVYQFLMKEVMGKDPATGNKLTEEEWNRQIDITIQDTITEDILESNYVYNIREYKDGNNNGLVAENERTRTKTIKTYTTKANIQITKADTWMMYLNVFDSAQAKTEYPLGQNPGLKAVSGYPSEIANPVRPSRTEVIEIPSNTVGASNSAAISQAPVKTETHTYTYSAEDIRLWEKQTINTAQWQEGAVEINQEKLNEKAQRIIAAWDVKYEHPISKGMMAPGDSFKSAPEWLFELLSGSRTQKQKEIFKYLVYVYTGKNYGVTQLDQSIYKEDINITLSTQADIIVDTTKSESKIVITEKEKLISAIKKCYNGKVRTNLVNQADIFIEMQKKYNVNAVFAMAVAITESSAGTNWDLISSSTYNWYSIQGTYNGNSYTDKNGTKWRKYPNSGAAITDFGKLIAEGSPYFKAGNYTVRTIGEKYCSPPESWISSVMGHMQKIYSAMDIDISLIYTDEDGNPIIGDESGYDGTYFAPGEPGEQYMLGGNYTWKYTDEQGRTFTVMNAKKLGHIGDCVNDAYKVVSSGLGKTVYNGNQIKSVGNQNWNIGHTPQLTASEKRGVLDEVAKGNIVILKVQGGYYSNNSHHAIIILDIVGDQVLVADPYITYYSGKTDGWMSINTFYERALNYAYGYRVYK